MRAFEDVEFLNVFVIVSALIGIHLIEPFQTLTHYKAVTYEELIPISKELYNDFQTTDASDLLSVDQFGFSFASSRLKMEEVIKWDPVILNSLKEATMHYENKVLDVLKMLLPELEKGWFVQRGSIFGFGDYDPSCKRLVTAMNQEQLNKAPINNMDPERGVGLINYSLGLYGRNELAAASNGYLKGRSWDLVEMKPASEFLKFKKVVSEMNELIVSWKSAQSAL